MQEDALLIREKGPLSVQRHRSVSVTRTQSNPRSKTTFNFQLPRTASPNRRGRREESGIRQEERSITSLLSREIDLLVDLVLAVTSTSASMDHDEYDGPSGGAGASSTQPQQQPLQQQQKSHQQQQQQQRPRSRPRPRPQHQNQPQNQMSGRDRGITTSTGQSGQKQRPASSSRNVTGGGGRGAHSNGNDHGSGNNGGPGKASPHRSPQRRVISSRDFASPGAAGGGSGQQQKQQQSPQRMSHRDGSSRNARSHQPRTRAGDNNGLVMTDGPSPPHQKHQHQRQQQQRNNNDRGGGRGGGKGSDGTMNTLNSRRDITSSSRQQQQYQQQQPQQPQLRHQQQQQPGSSRRDNMQNMRDGSSSRQRVQSGGRSGPASVPGRGNSGGGSGSGRPRSKRPPPNQQQQQPNQQQQQQQQQPQRKTSPSSNNSRLASGGGGSGGEAAVTGASVLHVRSGGTSNRSQLLSSSELSSTRKGELSASGGTSSAAGGGTSSAASNAGTSNANAGGGRGRGRGAMKSNSRQQQQQSSAAAVAAARGGRGSRSDKGRGQGRGGDDGRSHGRGRGRGGGGPGRGSGHGPNRQGSGGRGRGGVGQRGKSGRGPDGRDGRGRGQRGGSRGRGLSNTTGGRSTSSRDAAAIDRKISGTQRQNASSADRAGDRAAAADIDEGIQSRMDHQANRSKATTTNNSYGGDDGDKKPAAAASAAAAATAGASKPRSKSRGGGGLMKRITQKLEDKDKKAAEKLWEEKKRQKEEEKKKSAAGSKEYDEDNPEMETYRIEVPDDAVPGEMFTALAGETFVRLKCPPHVKPGEILQLTVPKKKDNNANNGMPPDSPNVRRVPGTEDDEGRWQYLVKIPEDVEPLEKFPVTISGMSLVVTCPEAGKPGTVVKIRPPAALSNTKRGKKNKPPKDTQLFEVVVPQNVKPGNPFALLAGGVRVQVSCPLNAKPGMKIRFHLPRVLLQQDADNASKLSKIKLSYDKDGWTRTIRVSDMKFQWVRMDHSGQIDTHTRFSAKNSAYVREMKLLDGDEQTPHLCKGEVGLIAANDPNAVIDSSVVDPETEEVIISYADIAAAQIMEFDKKAEWFQEMCAKLATHWESGHIGLAVRRDYLLHDSMEAVLSLPPDAFRKTWRFEFIGEAGLDAGGLSREWFQLVTEQLFDPDLGLWVQSEDNQMLMDINPASEWCCPDDHLRMFRFLGRVMGKAMFDGQIVAGHMIPTLYKYFLSWPCQFVDLKGADEALYENLNKLLDMPPDQIEYLCLDFTVMEEAMGMKQTIDLIPNGADTEATGENLPEYLEANFMYRMMGRIKPQLNELLLGFLDVIPEALLTVFDFQELELLMCGLPHIDMDDWKANTEYTGALKGAGPDHDVITWWWEVVEEFDEEMKARLLQFVTATSGVPSRGFGYLQGNDGNIMKFTVMGVEKSECLYPRSHTCFNRIDLPMYESKEDLQEKVELAITMVATGFDIE